jgi:hypothetical protein
LPSFPDLHDDVDAGAPVVAAPGPVAPADVLARVKTEGLRRRTRRHRRNGVLAALGIALLAVPAVALLPEDGTDDVTVAAEGDREAERPATTGARRPTTTVTTGTTLPPPSTASTVVVEGEDVGLIPPLVIEREPTATTVPAAPVCRNSTDPACGEFRWDPAPAANQDLTAAFVDVPATVTAGEPTTFFVAWSDPDATLAYDMFSADNALLAQPCQIENRFGPWTPPPAEPGSGELSYTHTFEAPGTYTVAVALATGACDSPYNSQGTVYLDVTVV